MATIPQQPDLPEDDIEYEELSDSTDEEDVDALFRHLTDHEKYHDIDKVLVDGKDPNHAAAWIIWDDYVNRHYRE